MAIGNPSAVIVYRLGSIGDTVIALPAFHKIRKTFTDSEIILLSNRPVSAQAAPLESVLGSDYFFNQTINYPVGTRSLRVLYELVKQIRATKANTLIYLAGAGKSPTLRASRRAVLRDKIFFRLAGITEIIGLPLSDADHQLQINESTGFYEWEAKRLARRISALGEIELKDNSYWDLCLTETELKTAEDALKPLLKDKPVFAISTGTKRQTNDWEENNWLKLLSELKSKLNGWQLIILGAKQDSARAETILKLWGNAGLNLCGQLSPRVSAAVLKKTRLFIGHDSGPMHLAACVGVPCIAIFSARDLPGQWFPRGENNKILYHKTDCAGCGLELCIVQQKKCILSTTVHEVIESIMQIVNADRQATQLPAI